MHWQGAGVADGVMSAVDWFIPDKLRTSNATLWRARHFVISHVIGPFSAVAIFGYLYQTLPEADLVFWTACGLCGGFQRRCGAAAAVSCGLRLWARLA